MNNTPAETETPAPLSADTAAGVLDLLKSTDENGEFWWMSDVFSYIGYSGPRQMGADVMRALALGARTGCVDGNDFINVSIRTGGLGRPRSDWRMTRRGLHLFIVTCQSKSHSMDLLRSCLAVLALG